MNLANQTDLDKAPELDQDKNLNNEEPYFNSEVRRDIENEKILDDGQDENNMRESLRDTVNV